jgi:hypothetical protein
MVGNALRTHIVLQPRSIHHFRCYHRDDTSSIEVTPLATFIERYPFIEGMITKIDAMMQFIHHDIILQLPVGSKIIVCNIQSKPKLNGRAGVIEKSSRKHKVLIDRIPVLIEGGNGPVQLKPSCIQLPIKKRGRCIDLSKNYATSTIRLLSKNEKSLKTKRHPHE